MIVILLKDVKGTGQAGDVVKVSPGYARNMLIPKGLAAEASDRSMRDLEKQKALIAEKRAGEKQSAEALAARLSDVTVALESKSGEGGRLFGSVTSKDIADALEEQHGIAVDKKKIVMDSPIKQVGETEVAIKLFQDVAALIKVTVTARD